MDLKDQRLYKVDRIKELYDARNTQEFISHKFSMNISDVGLALRILDYSYTRKKNVYNLKEGESLKPFYFIDELEFLDEYPLKNFT